MNESKYKSYDDLPLMLSVPEVAEVLGIGRAHAYELAKAKSNKNGDDKVGKTKIERRG